MRSLHCDERLRVPAVEVSRPCGLARTLRAARKQVQLSSRVNWRRAWADSRPRHTGRSSGQPSMGVGWPQHRRVALVIFDDPVKLPELFRLAHGNTHFPDLECPGVTQGVAERFGLAVICGESVVGIDRAW